MHDLEWRGLTQPQFQRAPGLAQQDGRPGFGRGLCVVGETLVAAGSSPSTIALHDLEKVKTVSVVSLTTDVRNAIHGLEVWPFG